MHGSDLGDLFTEQKAGDVDLVHQAVAHDHLRREGCLGTDLVAVDVVQDEQPSRAGSRPGSPAAAAYSGSNRRMKPTWTSGRPPACSASHDPQRRFTVHGQRLLAQGRLAALDAGEHLLLVDEPRRGEQDGVDLGIGDQVQRIGDRPDPVVTRGERRRPVRGRVGHRDQPGAAVRAASRSAWSAPISPTPMIPTRSTGPGSSPAACSRTSSWSSFGASRSGGGDVRPSLTSRAVTTCPGRRRAARGSARRVRRHRPSRRSAAPGSGRRGARPELTRPSLRMTKWLPTR